MHNSIKAYIHPNFHTNSNSTLYIRHSFHAIPYVTFDFYKFYFIADDLHNLLYLLITWQEHKTGISEKYGNLNHNSQASIHPSSLVHNYFVRIIIF